MSVCMTRVEGKVLAKAEIGLNLLDFTDDRIFLELWRLIAMENAYMIVVNLG